MTIQSCPSAHPARVTAPRPTGARIISSPHSHVRRQADGDPAASPATTPDTRVVTQSRYSGPEGLKIPLSE